MQQRKDYFSFLLSSCTQEEEFAPQIDSDAVRISATIGTMPQTRLAYSPEDSNGEEATTFTGGDQILVYNISAEEKIISPLPPHHHKIIV